MCVRLERKQHNKWRDGIGWEPPRRGVSDGEAVSDEASRDAGPSAIDWRSPRWREGDAVQGDVEREHRLRHEGAPAERGAIDREGIVGRGEKRDRPQDPEQAQP